MSRRLVAALALSLPLAVVGCDPPPYDLGAVDDVAGDASAEVYTVDPQLAADLAYLREEEKLARDVYTTLYEHRPMMMLANIAASEQAHMDAVAASLAAWGLPDPVVDDTVGVFVDPELDALYDQLVAAGRASNVAALTVAAAVEERDIADLEAMIGYITEPATLALLTNLQCASRNHMRIFVDRLTTSGDAYGAQVLSQGEVDAIVAAAREDCGTGM
ncbi:MAG: DUF2202 domain-containing protein [Deltaproteobacteria bacterium]|nr:MAG: DUF2202 domain-containing protein [Deltaproteobacteria bacterium]